MSKNPAVWQKILGDWFRLPERQELFAGLLSSKAGNGLYITTAMTDHHLLDTPQRKSMLMSVQELVKRQDGKQAEEMEKLWLLILS